jgi:hypothetical protein
VWVVVSSASAGGEIGQRCVARHADPGPHPASVRGPVWTQRLSSTWLRPVPDDDSLCRPDVPDRTARRRWSSQPHAAPLPDIVLGLTADADEEPMRTHGAASALPNPLHNRMVLTYDKRELSQVKTKEGRAWQ